MLLLTNAQGQLDALSTEADGSLFHIAGYPIATGEAPGHAAVVTFPEKAATPTPATPAWLALALGVAFALLGALRLSP